MEDQRLPHRSEDQREHCGHPTRQRTIMLKETSGLTVKTSSVRETIPTLGEVSCTSGYLPSLLNCALFPVRCCLSFQLLDHAVPLFSRLRTARNLLPMWHAMLLRTVSPRGKMLCFLQKLGKLMSLCALASFLLHAVKFLFEIADFDVFHSVVMVL